ncbi:MAG TPA: class I SAM-dependent methyltransferase [Candidatus Polarisedimenticolaceae bacterium]|nr:class I SAM-dependent methyltransferase [Candidatus Polarisedimenticolaceae bacterium]
MNEVPDFSLVAKDYGVARPGYPDELFDWLAATVAPARETAWDAATGSGQAAWGLAHRFDRVIATDISEEQLRRARRHPRIEYRVARSEASGLPDASVDLAVSAAAAHWFDLPRYYEELQRVVRPGGVAVAWTYHVAHVDPPLDAILWHLYKDVLGPYYPPNVLLVDDRFAGIQLPGRELATPALPATVRWSARHVAQFAATWSTVPGYIAATGTDPIPQLEATVAAAFGGPDVVRELRFPLYIRAARL